MLRLRESGQAAKLVESVSRSMDMHPDSLLMCQWLRTPSMSAGSLFPTKTEEPLTQSEVFDGALR